MAAVESLILDLNPMVTEVLEKFTSTISANGRKPDKAVLHFFQAAFYDAFRNSNRTSVRKLHNSTYESHKVIPQ